MKNNYYIQKDTNTEDIVIVDFNEMDGYRITPKIKKEDTIEVNKIVIVSPTLSEKIIKKNTQNSFRNTTLKKELDLNNVTDLVICGMMTHICVDATVKSAKDFGYNVTLVSDACTTRDIEWNGERIPANVVQNVYMSSLDGTFANVLTNKEYFKEI